MAETDFRTDVLPLKDKLFRLALRVTLDRHEAEDITQETLIRLWERRDEWNQIENMEAYALTICRRLALDIAKKQSRSATYRVRDMEQEEQESALPSPAPQPDEQLDQRMRAEAVRRLIDQLPEIQRTVIQLRDVEGMRYDEIAQVTALSETQVKVYLHRARTKIRTALA